MSEKVVIDLDKICGGLRGFNAAKAVREHVLGTLGLSESDSSTRVYYSVDGVETEWWNAPFSMTIDESAKTVNGGFRTRLGYALNGRTKQDVANATGTQGQSGDGKSRSPVKRESRNKLGINLDVDAGVVNLVGENADGKIDYALGKMSASLLTMASYSRDIYYLCSSGTNIEMIKSMPEFDDEGNIIDGKWIFEEYAVSANTADEAKMKILTAAVAKMDFITLAKATSLEPSKQDASRREIFINTWMKLPEKEEIVIPAPSETPPADDPAIVAGVTEESGKTKSK